MSASERERNVRQVRERELSERGRSRVRMMREVSERERGGGVRDFGVLRVWGKNTRCMKFLVQNFQKPRHRDGAIFFALWRDL